MDGLFAYDDPAASRQGSSGGTLAGNTHDSAPLAVRMRPQDLDELVGQQHLLAPGAPLRRLVEGDQPMSLLLWGPPGTGKTTIASIVSGRTNRHFVEVSAVAAGVKEVRAAIDAAPRTAGLQRRGDGALRRRGAPLHQGAAGRPAARRGEPLGDAGRGHHREPLLLGDLTAAVPVAAAHPGAAHRRRRPRRASRGRSPTRAGSTGRSPWSPTRSTTWSGSPAVTRGAR